MSKFVVVGAGVTGTLVAENLGRDGHEVVIVSRRGAGPDLPGVSRVALDAADSSALSQLARRASALFNCANPPYHRWPTDWPPIANSLLAAAESSGATLVTLSNLYGYGQPTRPMKATDPQNATYEKAQVRVKMWTDALALHEAGRIRAVEVRASDFVGAHCDSMLGERAIARIRKGKSVQVIGRTDVAHSWTFVGDVSRTLVAVALNDSSWGRAWHAPTNDPRTIQEAVNDLADAAAVKHVKASSVPASVLKVLGLFNPMMRELPTTMYQFSAPFVIDDSDTRDLLSLTPTPWDTVMDNAVGRDDQRSAAPTEP